MEAHEPRQVRKEATVSDNLYVPQGCLEARKDRNPVPGAVTEGQPALVLCFEKGTACSLQRAESGFRSFSRCPVPCFDPSRPSRKNRNGAPASV